MLSYARAMARKPRSKSQERRAAVQRGVNEQPGTWCPICGEVFTKPAPPWTQPPYEDKPHADWRDCVRHLAERVEALGDRVSRVETSDDD